jgi:hypothetical protein
MAVSWAVPVVAAQRRVARRAPQETQASRRLVQEEAPRLLGLGKAAEPEL